MEQAGLEQDEAPFRVYFDTGAEISDSFDAEGADETGETEQFRSKLNSATLIELQELISEAISKSTVTRGALEEKEPLSKKETEKAKVWEKLAKEAKARLTLWWKCEARLVQSEQNALVVAWTNGELHGYTNDMHRQWSRMWKRCNVHNGQVSTIPFVIVAFDKALC